MDTITNEGLYRLLTWLSPSFPVGAFAYSHGLETAVEANVVNSGDALASWVQGVIAFGAGRTDAGLFRGGWEAIRQQDDARLTRLTEKAEALRGTKEMALESAAQGRAFLETVLKVWPHPRLARWFDELALSQREPAYALAVGIAAATAEVPLQTALTAYLNALAANVVSAGVRLVPLGQTDGQRAMAQLEPVVVAAVASALACDPDVFGAAAVSVDLFSMQHETQYTRLFRS